MPRKPVAPEQRLETVTIRLDQEAITAVDLVAFGLSCRAGRLVKRSAAVRFMLGPTVTAITKRTDLSAALRATREVAVEVARSGIRLALGAMAEVRAEEAVPIVKAIAAAKENAVVALRPKRPASRKRPPKSKRQ